ncbi:MAG TPA: serine/threonine-protein kinase, partial [Amycolatopsis sp.]|uniref:serine/threonine-protein kinase n=1 Tax=Amycolatopsis sp. TaxID=37632 RepID=UPI002F3F9082
MSDDEGRLVAGRYRIVGRIGTGAMGAVWQAHDEVLGRTVAIKQLLLQPHLDEHDAEDARQRTMREGRIAARLHHPNAISVFDVVTDDNGQPCLIMEYLNSTSLAAVLQERRTLPPTEVARIGAQVAAALREAHAVGIVHRDIKPGNILLAGNGTVKITDFGISRAKDDVTVTKTGMIAGTPAYLAPEVAIGGDPGPESDVFSLGSTLYAACEGQPPFGLSENTLSLLHAVAAGQIIPPRQSGPLASVLAVLLHPDVQHRPTAEECEELLAAVARGETPLGGPAEDTMLAPSAGVLGAAAVADPNATQMFDEIPAGHSGTLAGDAAPTQAVPYYDEDDYPEATGYPEDDYDGYDHYREDDQYAAGGVPPGLAATRAVPVPPHGQDPYADDQYDDYDDEP